MILLAFATKIEAQPFIEYHSLTKQNTSSLYDVYGGGNISLIITGMGALKGAVYLSEIIQQRKLTGHPITEIINYGVAGCVCDTFCLGEVIAVDKVIKYDPVEWSKPKPNKYFSSSFPDITLTLKGKDITILATSDHPIFTDVDAQRVAQHAHLVDMEGYGYAFAANGHGIPIQLVKGISDFAYKDSEKSFKNKMESVLKKLLSFHSTREVIKERE
jgi:adenosylhomocysteine nucleosidase